MDWQFVPSEKSADRITGNKIKIFDNQSAADRGGTEETMKNYTITVNGNVYDVTVEEGTGSAAAGSTARCETAAAPCGSF